MSLFTQLTFLSLCIHVVFSDFVHSPTRRQVRISSIVSRIETPSILASKNLLYEILDDHTLVGHDRTVRLLEVTNHVRRVDPPPLQTIVIDGVKQSKPASSISIREGAGYTVVTDEDNTVHFITAEHLHLVPLDVEAHPNVFVNSFRPPQKRRVDRELTPRITEDTDVSETSQAALTAIAAPGVACSLEDPRRVLELAVSSDSRTCKVYGGNAKSTMAKLNYLVSRVSGKYSDVSCLSVSPVYMEIFCVPSKDPYLKSRKKKRDPLFAFEERWVESKTLRKIKRDLSAYIAPKYDSEDSEGTAFTAVSCRKYDISWTHAERDDDHVVNTLAHEMGHNLGLDHVEWGIMGGGSGPHAKFSVQSVNALLPYLRTKHAKCITRDGEDEMPNGVTCTTSKKVPNCVKRYKKIGIIKGLRVQGKWRNVRVAMRFTNGKVYIRMSVRSKPDKHPTLGNIHYDIDDATAVIEYGSAGGVKVDPVSETGSKVTFTVPEAKLRTPFGKMSCCGNMLHVNIQAFLYGMDGRDNVHNDMDIALSQTVSVMVPCKSCNADEKVLRMSNSRKCPVCKTV